EERAVDPLLRAIAADRLGDGEDVLLVEARLQRRSPVPGSAERDALRGDGGVRHLGEIGADELGDVDEHRRRSGLTGERADRHDATVPLPEQTCAAGLRFFSRPFCFRARFLATYRALPALRKAERTSRGKRTPKCIPPASWDARFRFSTTSDHET